MKKLFYIGALSMLLLAACGETEEQPKESEEVEVVEETEVEDNQVEEKEVEEDTLSDAQLTTIEAFNSNEFKTFADAFYGLEAAERSDVYREAVEGQFVTWTGKITDLETIGDSIVMYGDETLFDGSDWITLQQETPEKVPYVIIVEMANEADKQGLKVGDTITLKGEIGARGDKALNYNWKLYKGEIIK